MIKVSWEGDKVILDMGTNRGHALMSPLGAEKLADGLDEAAAKVELEPAEVIKGQLWDVKVTNYDKKPVLIWRCLNGPTVARIPLPVKAALAIADLLRTNAHFAGHGLRIHFSRN